MNITGGSRAGAGDLAAHLLHGKDNDLVKAFDPRGTVAQDIAGALAEMEAMASGVRCKYPLYHARISPRADEAAAMTPEQWEQAADTLQEKLGLDSSYQRAMVMHEKKGRLHMHVVFGRVNPETLRVWHDGRNYEKHEHAARQMERDFGHDVVRGVFTEREQGAPRPERRPRDYEWQHGARIGRPLSEVRDQIREAKNESDNGQAFAHALEARGLKLAAGDDRDFVVVYDGRKGPGFVALGARVLGMRAAEVRDFMSDVDRSTLPSVADATDAVARDAAQQLERAEQAQRQQEADRTAAGDRQQAERAAAAERNSAARDLTFQTKQDARAVARGVDATAHAAKRGLERGAEGVGRAADVGARVAERALSVLTGIVADYGRTDSELAADPSQRPQESHTMARDPLKDVDHTKPIDHGTRYELERKPSANPDHQAALRAAQEAAKKRRVEIDRDADDGRRSRKNDRER